MIYAGIDAGSRTIKVVLIDSGNMQVLAKGLTDQGVEQDKLASELFEKVLKFIECHHRQCRRYARDNDKVSRPKHILGNQRHARGAVEQHEVVFTPERIEGITQSFSRPLDAIEMDIEVA